MEKVGALTIDPIKLARAFPSMKPGISAAINDISIANSLGFPPVAAVVPMTLGEPAKSIYGGSFFMIPRLDDILSD
ncbi:MAG: hypothetical protein ACXWN9_11070 [Candidatus Binataceae bacterium]